MYFILGFYAIYLLRSMELVFWTCSACSSLLKFTFFFFFLTDSVEDGEKLVKSALEAFGRIGTVA